VINRYLNGMATVTEIEQNGVSLEEALAKTSKYYSIDLLTRKNYRESRYLGHFEFANLKIWCHFIPEISKLPINLNSKKIGKRSIPIDRIFIAESNNRIEN
jgi:hypothetical protein